MSEVQQKNINDLMSKIPFVGEVQAKKFARLGIKTVEELLNFLPKSAVDLSMPQKIAHLRYESGEKILVEALAEDLSVTKTPRRRMWLVKAKLRDGTGELAAIWFNQPYLRNFFKSGVKYLFYGEITYDFTTGKPQLVNPEIFPHSGIYLQYPQTEGLTSRQISRVVKSAVDRGYRLSQLLSNQKDETENLHFPKSLEDFQKAKRQFIYQKLLVFITANLYLREQNRKETAFKINPDKEYLREFAASLPFKLTADQGEVISDILDDFSKKYPMNRLLQGDVGSGKTIVALCAAILAIKSGFRVAWLAPTEILAQQHAETVRKFITRLPAPERSDGGQEFVKFIKLGLLTSSTKKLNPYSLGPMPDLIIGTHALLQKNVEIKKLALVIVDEQHRFGVEQRAQLLQDQRSPVSADGHRSRLGRAQTEAEVGKIKNQNDNQKSKKFENCKIRNSLKIKNCKIENSTKVPHLLSLTATPIPRTLAHIVFGNLDISTIRHKPAGRLAVKTFLVPQNKRADSYGFIDGLIAKGQQVFVICPLISDSSLTRVKPLQDGLQGFNPSAEQDDRKTVLTEVENLKKTVLGKRKIVALHGRMKGSEKDEIMRDMRGGKIDILVSTSVVEVGVDISRATVMVIEDAERFGLSQLHQFRGRVGRSNLQSYCFLYSNVLKNLRIENAKTMERLKVFVQNSDGFKLAEMDLKQRGPGALLGTEQSGFRGLNPLWFENTEVLERASRTARDLISKLDSLPELKEKVLNQLETEHLE